MTITITRDNYSYLLDEAKIRWSLLNRNNLLFRIAIFIIGILVLVFDIYSYRQGKNSLNFFNGIGIYIVAFSIAYTLRIYIRKSDFITKTESLIARYHRLKYVTEIIISDDELKYKFPEAYFEFKWNYFKYFMVHKNYIFIYDEEKPIHSFTIRKEELPQNKFNDLLNFLSTKLSQKK